MEKEVEKLLKAKLVSIANEVEKGNKTNYKNLVNPYAKVGVHIILQEHTTAQKYFKKSQELIETKSKIYNLNKRIKKLESEVNRKEDIFELLQEGIDDIDNMLEDSKYKMCVFNVKVNIILIILIFGFIFINTLGR